MIEEKVWIEWQRLLINIFVLRMEAASKKITISDTWKKGLVVVLFDNGTLSPEELIPSYLQILRENTITQNGIISAQIEVEEEIELSGHYIGAIANKEEFEDYFTSIRHILNKNKIMLFTSLKLQSQQEERIIHKELSICYKHGTLLGPYYGIIQADLPTITEKVKSGGLKSKNIYRQDDNNYILQINNFV